ncbi:MAG TPA: dienelactone hydrolase family protein [Steroidobacteraceae bacterium]|nr:dienelactone hydrolase family protein [Steroidobacteraceae bacterium]
MSQTETLMARDGHEFNVYIAKPSGKARGAAVIVQEVFGLSPWILRTADSYAADGYLSVAPALFDRVRRNLVLGYSPPEVEQAMGYRKQIDTAKAVLDIGAAAAMARHVGKVAVIGFCWGGTLAWAAASVLPLGAAVCYYGAHIPALLPKVPACPTMLHFGAQDRSIPGSEVDRLRSAFPQAVYHLYAAGHAFANDERPDHYDADATALARSHTNAFLARHIG